MPSFKKKTALVIAADIILAALLVYQVFFRSHDWDGTAEKRLSVKQGQTLNEIAEELKNSDIIASRTIFRVAAMILGRGDDIKANTYVFKKGLSNLEVLDILSGRSGFVLIRYTLPPGSTLRQAARIAEKTLSHSQQEFLKAAENDSLLSILGLTGKVTNLEGFLYPDSYDVSPGISEKELVGIMFNQFLKKVFRNEAVMNDISRNGTDLLNTVTLASIIEAETNLENEKPVIAGVYLNRLKKGMRLEADPTVQYVLPGGPKPRLLYEDLKIKSPYNTYLNSGLPPGPINNPDISCITAALNPELHNYYFFVATGNGGHTFTENYEQHMRAVQEFRKNRQKKNN